MSETIRSNETVKNFPDRYNFFSMRPGGNDTALVGMSVADKERRKLINDSIMAIYPNIEQVGFAFTDSEGNLNLTMAGGEFCGNATRSTAYLALQGKSGDLEIRVSGVTGKLKAGVKDNGEAYAQMPIYPGVDKVVNDPENSQAWLVMMEGIAQYVIFQDKPLSESPEDLKKEAMKILEDKGLKQMPAAGVIYASKNGNGWKIDPVVYVRDINTCFYETACGSGTTALGQVLAIQQQASIDNVAVTQPSGEQINVSVNLDQNGFGYAQICGKVQCLNQGVIKKDVFNKDYAVEIVTSESALMQSLGEEGLIELYQEAFKDPPYNEEFTPEEVVSYFQEYFSKGMVLLGREAGRLVGFAAAVDLISETNVAEIASKNGINPSSCVYIAELGVKKDARRRNIGTGMMEELLLDLPDKTPILRTSRDNIPAQKLYENMGFYIVSGMTESVTQKRVTGEEYADERIFMIKSL